MTDTPRIDAPHLPAAPGPPTEFIVNVDILGGLEGPFRAAIIDAANALATKGLINNRFVALEETSAYGYVPYATKTEMLADTSPAIGSEGRVYADTTANNGIYRKTGATTWSAKLAEIPAPSNIQFATSVGGTAAAFTATVPITPVAGSWVLFPPHVDSGAFPTISFNGGTARYIRPDTGVALVLGAWLRKSRFYLLYFSGTIWHVVGENYDQRQYPRFSPKNLQKIHVEVTDALAAIPAPRAAQSHAAIMPNSASFLVSGNNILHPVRCMAKAPVLDLQYLEPFTPPIKISTEGASGGCTLFTAGQWSFLYDGATRTEKLITFGTNCIIEVETQQSTILVTKKHGGTATFGTGDPPARAQGIAWFGYSGAERGAASAMIGIEERLNALRLFHSFAANSTAEIASRPDFYSYKMTAGASYITRSATDNAYDAATNPTGDSNYWWDDINSVPGPLLAGIGAGGSTLRGVWQKMDTVANGGDRPNNQPLPKTIVMVLGVMDGLRMGDNIGDDIGGTTVNAKVTPFTLATAWIDLCDAIRDKWLAWGGPEPTFLLVTMARMDSSSADAGMGSAVRASQMEVLRRCAATAGSPRIVRGAEQYDLFSIRWDDHLEYTGYWDLGRRVGNSFWNAQVANGGTIAYENTGPRIVDVTEIEGGAKYQIRFERGVGNNLHRPFPIGIAFISHPFKRYANLAARDADSPADGTEGRVYADPTPANNGIYNRTAGAWSAKVSDLTQTYRHYGSTIEIVDWSLWTTSDGYDMITATLAVPTPGARAVYPYGDFAEARTHQNSIVNSFAIPLKTWAPNLALDASGGYVGYDETLKRWTAAAV